MKQKIQALKDAIELNLQHTENISKDFRKIHEETRDKKVLEPTRILEQCALKMKRCIYLLNKDFK